jgi:hypothetical protein
MVVVLMSVIAFVTRLMQPTPPLIEVHEERLWMTSLSPRRIPVNGYGRSIVITRTGETSIDLMPCGGSCSHAELQ